MFVQSDSVLVGVIWVMPCVFVVENEVCLAHIRRVITLNLWGLREAQETRVWGNGMKDVIFFAARLMEIAYDYAWNPAVR